jgi:branched-chain amino acid aminotransferase
MLQKFDERNRDLIVNINGELLHRDKAAVSPFDSAVQGGDAVWEGLRLYNGRIFKLHEHLDRLERSARAVSFEEIPQREKIIDEIKRTLAANKMRDGAHIRLTLTRGVKTMHSCSTHAALSLKRTRRMCSSCVTPTNPEVKAIWQQGALWHALRE